MKSPAAKDFIPFDLRKEKDSFKLQWVNPGNLALDEPFFDNNVKKNLSTLSPHFYETDLLNLYNFDRARSLPPNGFIFHMSRCGSTLLTNLLRKIPGTIAHGEPEVLDQIGMLLDNDNHDYVARLFTNVIYALGLKRSGEEQNYIIKFPSYGTMLLPVVGNLFPRVPRLFLYRDPVEVIVSNLEQPYQDWIFSKYLINQPVEKILQVNSVLENCALALKGTCEFFLQQYDPATCMAVNYSQLSQEKKEVEKLLVVISEKFNLSFTRKDIEAAMSEMQKHSKNQDQPFAGDAKRKKEIASARIEELAGLHLAEVYRRLEAVCVKL